MNNTTLMITTTNFTKRGGRALLSNTYQRALRLCSSQTFLCYELPPVTPTDIPATILKSIGYIDGVTRSSIAHVLQLIDKHKVTQLFVDGSNLGLLTRAVKQNYPMLPITTLYHNIETFFFLGSFFSSPTPRSLAILVANYFAELQATIYSDSRICLTSRDSQLLCRLFARPATHIFPLVLNDTFSIAASPPAVSSVPNPYLLFVGSNFYANVHGISWFIRTVAPYIPFQTVIVGNGMESLRPQLESAGNVLLVGTVENTSDWYLNAQAVIAPIFRGSGMKTKVAESLMHGKRIIGTPEAFTGYEKVQKDIGWTCTTSDDFIAALTELSSCPQPSFDPAMRLLFDKYYSFSAAFERLSILMSYNIDSSDWQG